MNQILVATITTTSNYADELRSALDTLALASRKEEGCSAYDVLCSAETPGKFTILEIWQSEKHLQKHHKTKHMLQFKENPVKARTEINIERFERI